MDAFAQASFGARFEWALKGLEELAASSDVVVVVDVLSFSTAVDIATARGARVFPYRSRDAAAAHFARRVGGTLAVSRLKMDAEHSYSLSPQSYETVSRGDRIVLPSPNGAALCHVASERCRQVLTGCLRNAKAVAERARSLGEVISVIAAGEKWKARSGQLRPAFEDLVGAGAILAELGHACPSPEALAAIGAFRAAEPRLRECLLACSSGRELIEMGFREDVLIAADLNASPVAPGLREGWFVNVSSQSAEEAR